MKKVVLFMITLFLFNNGEMYAEEFKEILPIEQRIIENAQSKGDNSIGAYKPEKIDEEIEESKLVKKNEEVLENEEETRIKSDFFQEAPKVTKEQFTGRVIDLAQKRSDSDGKVYVVNEKTPYTGKFALFLGDIIEYIENYEDGVLEGPKIWYSENGNIVLEETYKNNKIEGPQKAYYENGDLKSIVDYKNSKIVGLTVYSRDGKILHKEEFKQGTGKWKYFWSNGNLLEEGAYKNWKKDGIWKKYRENGEVDTITEYKNGKLIKTTWS